ncbi:MAG: S9 family peptidase [Candidatus Krumholzibacteriia bacterium]
MSRRILLLSLLLVTAVAVAAADPVVVPVARLLQAGPWPLPLPAFHDAAPGGVTLDDLAKAPSLDVALLRPRLGRTLAAPGAEVRWDDVAAPLMVRPGETWFAAYLRSDRWQQATLAVAVPDSAHLQLWLDGEAVTAKPGEGDRSTAELTLPRGVHTLLLRAVVDAGPAVAWSLAPVLTLAADLPAEALAATIESRRPADIHLVLDSPRVREVSLSPDGRLAAIMVGERPAGGEAQSWLELHDLKSGKLLDTWRGHDASQFDWAPDGARLSFVLPGDHETSDLWLYTVATGELTRLVRGIADLAGYQWVPDGGSVVYAVRVKAEPDKRKVKRVLNPADRQPWYRDRSYLMQVSVPAGVSRRLTAGPLSPGTWSLSPDGTHVLFFLEDEDLAGGRPYATSELWELDLATLAVERLLTDRWIGAAVYGPDPGTLLLQGSPSAFGGLGRDLPDGVQANDYGGQLYLLDRATNTARCLTRDFTPDVGRAWWSLDDGLVYALCTDTQFQNVYRCDPRRADWTRVDTGVEFTDQFALARHGRVAVARGTSVSTPDRVFAVDLKRNQARLLLDPGQDAWADVAFGEVTAWQAPLPDGELLDGRIYWPVDYDPSQRYPVIVYYYGGTSPVTVDFGGRYPKNVWAGQGYIVYVPEPSGATGYGQEFAARHVNDWGKRTAWEVIESTRAFLAAHPSADPEHVGCIGASYGGFLTEYVITQTDLFAAAVSHAGISSISSYWGEGLWGYVYGARALADAFPWDRRDVYVEQSALFHADRITTPLLLLHGDSDTNVPVGESDQLFTALKLLGREVEYVQVQGQDHHILDHDQRIVWNDTILAYFAKWLKGQDGWWQAMYPDPR